MSEEIPDFDETIERLISAAKENAEKSDCSHYPFLAGTLQLKLKDQIQARQRQRDSVRRALGGVLKDLETAEDPRYIAYAIGALDIIWRTCQDSDIEERAKKKMDALMDEYHELTGERI